MADFEPDKRRLAALERELAELRAELTSRAREPVLNRWRNPRLARTVRVGEEYPPESANTFGIVFLDSTFTEDEGAQTPTHTDRQSAPEFIAHTTDGGYVEENSVVPVFFDNGRWWIMRGSEGEPLVPFTLTASLTKGGSAAAMIRVWSGAAWVNGGSITVFDSSASQGPAGLGDRGYAKLDKDSGRYEVVSLEPQDSGGGGSSLIPVELYTHLDKGGSALARLRDYGFDWTTSMVEVTIFDSAAEIGPLSPGDYAWVELNDDSGRYETVSTKDQWARIVEFTCEQTMGKEELQTVATATRYVDGRPPPGLTVGGVVTVRNSRAVFQGERYKKGKAYLVPELSTDVVLGGYWYEIDWIECPERTNDYNKAPESGPIVSPSMVSPPPTAL